MTVAVVSWNTRELLAECLVSLRDDAEAGVADVWVVDNASSDGSAEAVRRFPWARLIASRENLGFGNAVNLVAARTGAPWLAPANADTTVEPGAIRALLEHGKLHPEAAVIAPRLILPDGSTQRSVYPFPTIPFTLAYLSGANRLSARLAHRWAVDRGFNPDLEREVPWAIGAFLLVRRSAWLQVGGFDQAQWMYAEDLDLGWRLSRAGWTARYLPGARVHHAESAATKAAWGDARHQRWHGSTYAWMMRRRGLSITRIVAGLNVVGFFLQALVRWPLAFARIGDNRQSVENAMNASRAHVVGLRSRRFLEQVR